MERRQRSLGERLRLVYGEDHPMRTDRGVRSRAGAIRLLAFLVAAAVLFWIQYAVTLQPIAFGVAAVLTFFALMRLRNLTKPRD